MRTSSQRPPCSTRAQCWRLKSAFGNVLSAANAEKRIWEALGLTADPKIMYDVCTTLTAAADAAGTLFLDCDYVI
jgi:hypothetical protein